MRRTGKRVSEARTWVRKVWRKETNLGGVHLVDGDDELPDTEGEGEKGVLSGLSVLGDTSLELSNTTSNDEDGAVGLRGSGDHVLDEISVTGSIDDGDHAANEGTKQSEK